MSTENKKNNRMLIAILMIAVLPMAAAYIMFFTGVGIPKNTVNHGYLLQPAIKMEGLLTTEVWRQISKEKKWRVVLPLNASCGESCQKNFYTTRQVHIRLGDKSERLERWAVNLGGDAGDALLNEMATNHPRLKTAVLNSAAWQTWVAGTRLPAELDKQAYYFLVDQEGFAIMAYDASHHGNELIDDIKHALKFSIDYD